MSFENNFSLSQRLKDFLKDRTINIFPVITDDAGLEEQPVQYTPEVWIVKTKPYPMTLNSQPNLDRKKWWWSLVRPLLIQTAALGPSENLRDRIRQPDFRGCRLIKVESGTISSIGYVTRGIMKSEIDTPRNGATDIESWGG